MSTTKLKTLTDQLKLISFTAYKLGTQVKAYTVDELIAMMSGGGPHHTTHEYGQSDEISLAGLTGLTSTPQTPASHGNASHTSAFGLVSDIAVDANLSTAAQDAVTKRHSNSLDHSNALDHAANGDTDLDTTFEATFEKVANKGAASGYAGLVSSKVPTANLGGAGAAATNYLRGDQTWAAPSPDFMQEALIECYPYGGAPIATLTPTAHGASVAMVYPFEIDRPITINAVYIRSQGVVANCLIIGIFNSSGTQVLRSGVLNTVATGWVAVTSGTTPSLPVTLAAGTYYFATTNNNVTSAVAAYTTTPAMGTATLPRWGTVAATSGAMPASITPGSITKTVGGWMCYVVLSNVTS